MSQGPEMPPPLPSQATKNPDLRSIAVRQKGVIVAMLVYLAAIVMGGTMTGQASHLRFFPAFAGIAASVVAVVFVFQLAMKVYIPAVGVLMGILALIPLLGLLILLAVNGRATRILKENGIKVGFFGADLNKIPQ